MSELSPRSTEDLGSPLKAFAACLGVILVGCGLAAAVFIALTHYLKAHGAPPAVGAAATAAYGLVCIGFALLAARFARRMTRCEPSPAARRYNRRILAAMSVYVVALAGAITVFKQGPLAGVLPYLLALAPALPVVAAIAIMGVYLREEADEVERSIKSQGALWATGGLLSVATVWGFLEMFGLVPHLEAWAAFPVWGLMLGLAEVVVRRRYR